MFRLSSEPDSPSRARSKSDSKNFVDSDPRVASVRRWHEISLVELKTHRPIFDMLAAHPGPPWRPSRRVSARPIEGCSSGRLTGRKGPDSSSWRALTAAKPERLKSHRPIFDMLPPRALCTPGLNFKTPLQLLKNDLLGNNSSTPCSSNRQWQAPSQLFCASASG
jgi:hypothetical protein